MKKIFPSLAAIVAAISLFSGTSTRTADATPIYAGQNHLVGDAFAFASDSVLYLYVWIDPQWDVSEIHFHAASSLSGIPTNGAGSPKIGKFDYTASDFTTLDLFGDKYLYLEIPKSSFENPTSPMLCLAFHAVVSPNVPIPGAGLETAWADGLPFDGGNWATYFCVGGSPGGDN